MHAITLGDVTIASIVERDGPWRTPEAMFPGYDPEIGRRHLAALPDCVYDPASNRLVITYQTFVVRTPRHTILVDTCTGEDKGHAAPLDFPKQPWLDGFAALGLRFADITHVFCTHLHVDHCGWNTRLVDGRWVPTFPNAKYVFHRAEVAFWEATAAREAEIPGGGARVWRMNCLPVIEAGQAVIVDDAFALDDLVTLVPTPGHTPGHVCVAIASRGRRAIVTGDLIHHALQIREPDWSTIFCWDRALAAQSRRRFLAAVAGTDALVLPVHFPAPTAGRVVADAAGFDWRFVAP